MKKLILNITLITLLGVVSLATYFVVAQNDNPPTERNESPLSATLEKSNSVKEDSLNDFTKYALPIEPIAEFKERITKKNYGLYITPETSPVQPDKFNGFHNAVDVEYGDILQEVPVYAIADGSVEFSGWTKGYGGVLVLRHNINGTDYFVLYGHLDPENMVNKNFGTIKAGDKIGVLGDGYSNETDGARKHLHFSIRPVEYGFNLRGYVEDEETLSQWVDPLLIY